MTADDVVLFLVVAWAMGLGLGMFGMIAKGK